MRHRFLMRSPVVTLCFEMFPLTYSTYLLFLFTPSLLPSRVAKLAVLIWLFLMSKFFNALKFVESLCKIMENLEHLTISSCTFWPAVANYRTQIGCNLPEDTWLYHLRWWLYRVINLYVSLWASCVLKPVSHICLLQLSDHWHATSGDLPTKTGRAVSAICFSLTMQITGRKVKF